MKTQIFDLKTEYEAGMDTAAQAIAEGVATYMNLPRIP